MMTVIMDAGQLVEEIQISPKGMVEILPEEMIPLLKETPKSREKEISKAETEIDQIRINMIKADIIHQKTDPGIKLKEKNLRQKDRTQM